MLIALSVNHMALSNMKTYRKKQFHGILWLNEASFVSQIAWHE